MHLIRLRYTPKTTREKVLFAAAVLAVVAIAVGFGFASDSALKIGSISSKTPTRWSEKHYRLNGSMQHRLDPKDGELHVEVETVSGQISIEMTDEDGNILFDQENIENGSYDVNVPGETLVRIDADNHRGSFKIE